MAGRQGRRGGRVVAGALAATIALAAGLGDADPARGGGCNPGNPGLRPPECPRGLGGAARHAIPYPSASTHSRRTAGFHFNRDVCAEVARWAPAHHDHRFGRRITWYWVWAELTSSPPPHFAVLVCGERRRVRGFGHGPGDGESIPCPTGDGIRTTRPDGVGWR